MNTHAKPWLPASAIADNTVTRLVTEHCTQWASRWFRDPKPLSASDSQISRPTKILSSTMCWATADSAVLLAVDEMSLIKTAGLLLGMALPPKLNHADMRLVRSLADKCFADLLGNLAKSFAAVETLGHCVSQAQVDDATKYALTFAAGGPAFDAYIDNDLVVSARRNAAKATRHGAPLATRDAAIARQTIRVGAALGKATIGLSELSALACGDVLVLDRACADELPITLNDDVFPAACVLQRADTALELRMTRLGAGVS